MVLAATKKIERYNVMLPIPNRGIEGLVLRHYDKGYPVRVAAVVVKTRTGGVVEPVEAVLEVEHHLGGLMLPQGLLSNEQTPYQASLSLLRKELNAPASAEKLIERSCILLGYHEHMVPKERKGPLSRIGSEVPKLLVFVKICVDCTFKIDADDIEQYVWATSLSQIEEDMSGMRNELKYFAEIDAVKTATGWQ